MTNNADYPKFKGGDVLIVASTGKTWKLHSFTLGSASETFAWLLASVAPIHLTGRQRADGKSVLYYFRMDVDMDDERFANFVPLDPTGKQILTMPPKVSGSHDDAEPAFVKIYDNFFRSIYAMDAVFDQSTSKTLIQDAIALLECAERLSGINSVRTTIETQLLRIGRELWEHIAAKPESWSDVGYRLRSPILFGEAIIHVVGRWKMGEEKSKREIILGLNNGSQILAFVEEKVWELDEFKKEVDLSLISFFPVAMLHNKQEQSKDPGRSVYARDIYHWQALTLTRQSIAHAILHDLSWRAVDGGAKLYRQIGAGNAAYLAEPEIEIIFQSFQMSPKGRLDLEHSVHYVKSLLIPLVQGLLVNHTQFAKISGAPEFEYLTCCEVTDADLPWKLERQEEDGEDETSDNGGEEDDESGVSAENDGDNPMSYS